MSWTTTDGIRVYSRRDWGARAPRAPYARQPYTHSLVYHHGGPEGPPRMTFTHASSTLRSWQAYHMDTHGWTDIGYNLAMDGLGRLYKCRPAWAIGAHVLMQNTGRIGLVYMQDGRAHGLTDGQLETTRKLFRKRHRSIGLPALKKFANHAGSDWGVFGHREVPNQSTECPGNLIAADLHRLIKEYTS